MLRKHPKYEREKAPGLLRRFCPVYHVDAVVDIEPVDLVDSGYRVALMDLDNTLLPWKGSALPQDTIDWVRKCHDAGLLLCLVSNTRNIPRLNAISEELNVPYVRARMKPSRQGFRRALRLLEASPEETVMIGDQMFTDVWGANRMGICSIMVKRMHHREFFGTKFSRLAERFVLWLLGKPGGSGGSEFGIRGSDTSDSSDSSEGSGRSDNGKRKTENEDEN